MSALAPWRVAARLARRETFRRPGRTVLVALLVAVPVMGMVVANVLSRTDAEDVATEFGRMAGDADIQVQLGGDVATPDPSVSDPAALLDARLVALLPAGSAWETEIGRWGVPIRSAERSTYAYFADVDLAAPIRDEVIELRNGRAPSSAGEVALDRRSAEIFGVDIGDRLVLDHPRGTWTVTGIARLSTWFESPLFITRHFDWTRVSGGWTAASSIVLPDGVSVDAVALLLEEEFDTAQVLTATRPPYPDYVGEVPAESLAWGWVFGTVALAVLGAIIAAAFATSARRQLVAIGQLSANGADRALLRLTLALQGSWSGVVGVATGMGLAAAVLAGARPLIERLAGGRLPAYEVAVTDLAVITLIGILAATLAALVPAWNASRVPVMAALAGRRPLGTVPRRLVPIGLLAFATGLALLVMSGSATAAARGDDLWALVAVLGGVLVLTAVVCTAPLVVDRLGRACASLPGTWRLGGRSLARTRARSAGLIAAIAAMTALVVAGATAWASGTTDEPLSERWIPANVVSAEACTSPPEGWETGRMVDIPPVTCVPPTGTLATALTDAVGPAQVYVGRAVSWDPAPFDSSVGPSPDLLLDGSLAIADPFLLDLIGLSDDDRQLLEGVGAIALTDVADSGAVTPPAQPSERVIETQDGERLTLQVAWTNRPFTSAVGTTGLLVSPERAISLGLPILDVRSVYVLSAALTRPQADRIVELSGDTGGNDVFDRPASVPVDESARYASILYSAPPLADGVLVEATLSLVATLLTLIIVAIGLALSAIESRDERDVLAAVGAPPRVVRSIASRKAFLLSFTGALIAVPAGLLPVLVVLVATDRSNLPLSQLVDIPWLTVTALVVGVPLVASAGAAATS
ncbi:MAG: hypothetical protein RLY45_1801, partial [Actinomycetota bacterium]